MNQNEKRKFLIRALLEEREENNYMTIPDDESEQKHILRSLFNIRMPGEIEEDFINVQDEYLKETIHNKGITDYKMLKSIRPEIYLWQGDITTLKCGAIV